MGYIVIKPDKDKDFYVLWSTETDRPVGYDSREAFIAEDPIKYSVDRMDWTDEHGCSSRIGEKWWDERYILVHNVTKKDRTVRRTDFADFTKEYIDAFPTDWDKFFAPKAARAVLKKYGTVFDYEG